MNEIPYEIVRTDRKSIALVIDSEANLIVRAPHKAKESDIADFVEKKSVGLRINNIRYLCLARSIALYVLRPVKAYYTLEIPIPF